MTTTQRDTAQRVARALARERRVEKVRPGWWVYSHGPHDLGGFDRVTETTTRTDPTTGRHVVTLRLTDQGGRRVTVENVRGYPAWCLTTTEARHAGLT